MYEWWEIQEVSNGSSALAALAGHTDATSVTSQAENIAAYQEFIAIAIGEHVLNTFGLYVRVQEGTAAGVWTDIPAAACEGNQINTSGVDANLTAIAVARADELLATTTQVRAEAWHTDTGDDVPVGCFIIRSRPLRSDRVANVTVVG